jgi:hypothetical protein
LYFKYNWLKPISSELFLFFVKKVTNQKIILPRYFGRKSLVRTLDTESFFSALVLWGGAK